MGHDALCQVCQDFPRLRHDYGDFVELGLELSCPEAARLILSSSQTFTAEIIPGEESPDYDVELMDILLESRSVAISLLDTSPLPPNHTLAVLLLYAHEVQSWIDGGNPAMLDVNVCLELAKKYAAVGNWNLFFEFFN